MENNTPKEAQTPETRNRNILKIAGSILIVIVIAALIGNGARKNASTDQSAETGLPDGCKPGYLFSETTGKPCPKDETAVETNTETAAPSAYEEAIRMYGGKVVLFDAECKALPAVQTLGAGTRILIANNSTKQLIIGAPDRTEALDSYHYFTYKLGTPGDISITCNSAASAKITISAAK